jgi:hypothetical protein
VFECNNVYNSFKLGCFMGVIQNSIGLRWEIVLNERYPDLISTSGDERVPDFYHPSGFWVEAKAGNIAWGGRIKQYQLNQVSDFKDPVVYAFGMHNFDNAMARLRQMTERGRQACLQREMDFVETYFISGEIVRGILERDTKVSEKGMKYCMVKPSTLRNVIFDRVFRRDGVQMQSSADYYGFSREDYIIDMEEGVGYVLHSEKEGEVFDFLKRNP